jgi:methylase of polypeptide subunit release factors
MTHGPAQRIEALLAAGLPARDDLVGKLARGAKVAELGCGDGASIVRLAEAFPRSRLFGFDPDPSAIERARARAAAAGLADRVSFEVAPAAELPGREYDLVCQVAAPGASAPPADAARRALATDGTWLLVRRPT